MKNSVIPAAGFLLALFAAGCELTEPSPSFPGGEPVYFDTSFADEGPASRTTADASLRVSWEASDEISILGANTSARGTVHSLSSDRRGAIFRATGVNDSELWAVHPYRAPGASGAPSLVSSGLRVGIPESQDGSFSSCNLCAAFSTCGGVFSFRNVAALLRFSIDDAALARSACSAEISALGGEPVAGTLDLDGSLSARWPSTRLSSISIPLAGSKAGTDIWAAVLPGDYSCGFRTRLLDSGGALLKEFSCPAHLVLDAGSAVFLGSSGAATPASGGFRETFSGCRAVGGSDGVMDYTRAGARLCRTNAAQYCDNPGWDFSHVSEAGGCVVMTAPDGSHSWLLTPPLGIEGCATLTLKASWYDGAANGLTAQVVGAGHIDRDPNIYLPDAGMASDTLHLCGLERDSRIKITSYWTRCNHTHIDDIVVTPGGEEFDYIDFATDNMVFPPCAGTYRIPCEISPGVSDIVGYAGAFTDCDTGRYVKDSKGKNIYFTAWSERGSSLAVRLPENTSGVRRKGSCSLYSSTCSAVSSFTVIQEPYE